MNIIMTSVQQNRKKDQVPVNCSQKSYTKLYQVLEAVGSFWPHTSPLIQHKVSAFSLPAIKVETFQDVKKRRRYLRTKNCLKTPRHFYNVFGGGEKTAMFRIFLWRFFWCCKTSWFFSLLEWSHFHTASHHRKGDIFGALCVGATLVAPRRAAVLGALQDTPSEDMTEQWPVGGALVKSIRNEILPPLIFRGFWISHEFKDPEPWANQDDSWFMSFTGWKNVAQRSKIWGLGMEIPLSSWCWSTR